MKKRLTREEIMAAKMKLILENFHDVSQKLGMDTSKPDIHQYKQQIVDYLTQKNAGSMLIKITSEGEYNRFIKSCYGKDLAFEFVAEKIRDAYYSL